MNQNSGEKMTFLQDMMTGGGKLKGSDVAFIFMMCLLYFIGKALNWW